MAKSVEDPDNPCVIRPGIGKKLRRVGDFPGFGLRQQRRPFDPFGEVLGGARCAEFQLVEGMKRLAPTPEAEARSREAVPLGRWGTTRDIANMAMFLASPFASYVSGAVIPVDGAMTVSNSGLSTNEIMKAIREGVAG